MPDTNNDMLEAKVLISCGYLWITRDKKDYHDSMTDLWAYTQKPIKVDDHYLSEMSCNSKIPIPIPKELFKNVTYESGITDLTVLYTRLYLEEML